MSKWISVEDLKPRGKCLVLLKNSVMGLTIHSSIFEDDYIVIGGKFEWDMIDENNSITHWMPLPEPPKE